MMVLNLKRRAFALIVMVVDEAFSEIYSHQPTITPTLTLTRILLFTLISSSGPFLRPMRNLSILTIARLGSPKLSIESASLFFTCNKNKKCVTQMTWAVGWRVIFHSNQRGAMERKISDEMDRDSNFFFGLWHVLRACHGTFLYRC